MSNHHRTRVLGAIAVTAGIAALGVAVTSASAGATTTLQPPTAFEIDGNRTVEGAGDWDGPYATGVTPTGAPTTGIYYLNRDEDPCASPTDDVGVGGEKAANGPEWPTAVGQPNAKTDLAAVSLAAEKVAVPGVQVEDILYASFERCGGASGSMSTLISIDDGDGITPAAGDDGDFLFRFDFDPNTGRTTVTMFVRTAGKWDETPIPAGSVEAAASSAPGDFGEVAINLTRLGILDEATCTPVTVTGQASTITGGDLQSQPKDLVQLTPLTISNCGALQVSKETAPITTDERFEYVVGQTDLKPVHDATLDVTGVTGTSEPDTDASEIDATIAGGETHLWTNVISQPDYRIAERALPDGWTLESITCTYSDIFQPLPNSSTVVIYEGGAPTGNEFVVPPSSFANQAVPPTSCVIVNQTTAIAIAKTGAGDPAERFTFDVTGHDPVTLAIGETADPIRVAAGTPVTITESAANGDWDLTGITCTTDDGTVVASAVDPVDGSIEVVPVLGSLVTCTFENVQSGRIELVKGGAPLGVGPFSFAVGWDDVPVELSIGDPLVVSPPLAPGAYTITELASTIDPGFATGVTCQFSLAGSGTSMSSYRSRCRAGGIQLR